MIGLILTFLIMCALVAAIWGQSAAQKLFKSVGIAALAIFVVIAVVIVAVLSQIQKGISEPGMVPDSSSSSGNSICSALAPVMNSNPNLAIGISYQPLNDSNAQKLNLPPGSGIYVNAVTPGSRAQNAGIQQGDAIVSIDNEQAGTTTCNGWGLEQAKARDASAGKIPMTISRGGQLINVVINF